MGRLVPIFLIPMLLAFALTPVTIRLSKRLKVEAIPGGRRKHNRPVARLGGIPILVAFAAGVGLIYWLIPPVGDDALRLRGVILGGLIVFIGGIVDDRWELSPFLQFAIQIAGALVAIWHIVFIEIFTNPINGQLVEIPWKPVVVLVTFIWIIGIINTVNWLDGLDGLATGVGVIAAFLFAWHSYRLGQEAVAAVPLVFAGALLGFLPFNYTPAAIFLGTAGAYFLGYNLATLSILSPAKIATALLVLAVPIIDGVWRVLDRIRVGRSPFYGDRGHLHFLLLDKGIPTRWIVAGYCGVSLSFGLVAIFATGLLKLTMLGLLATGLGALLIALTLGRSDTN